MAEDTQTGSLDYPTAVSPGASGWAAPAIALSLYGLLLAIGMVGSGFKWAAGDSATSLFEFATNPFLGLMIGTVSTALIQSSSTVSSITVGLVGGGLPVATAVPIIMGSNMGTTLTNTLVSLGHVRNKAEFRKAFSAATVHDFFNLYSIVLFLPLELWLHPFERMGGLLAGFLAGDDAGIDAAAVNPIAAATKPVIGWIHLSLGGLPDPYGGIVMALLGVGLIFLTISFIGRSLRSIMAGRAKRLLHAAIGRGPITGICSGTLVTMLVQSSSTTTSLMVPLAGSGVFTVRDIYPFILGANIGTCITALIAALGITGDHRVFALQIAFVHLLYNIVGVFVVYGVPLLRNLPIRSAEWLAEIGTRNVLYVAAYIVGVFFVIPLGLVFVFG